MKIYIATPVNGRKEKTLEEKQKAAEQRVDEIADFLMELYPDAEFMSSFNIIGVKYHVGDLSEAVIMGSCVRMVMESDLVVLDDGWDSSQGCRLEKYTAMVYDIKWVTLAWLKLNKIFKSEKL